jgi:hypothetical protein
MPDSSTGRDTKDRWLGIAERTIPLLLTLAVPVAGGIWAVFQYTQSQAELAGKREAEQLAQNRARVIELQKPFIDQQFLTYNQYVNLIGNLVSLVPQSQLWEEAETEFWKQHWSRLALVEDEDVHATKRAFASKLTEYKRKLDEHLPLFSNMSELEYKLRKLGEEYKDFPNLLLHEKEKLAEPMKIAKEKLDASQAALIQAQTSLREASVPLTTALRRSIQKSWAGQLGR